jgi:hypothetical protein
MVYTTNEIYEGKTLSSPQDDINHMYNKISSSCPDFKNLNLNQKLNWLLNVEDVEIILSVCNLIDKSVIYS